MVGAHLGHNVRVGSNTILANNVLLGGYAEVNNYAFIGGGSVVHQFTRLGAVSLLQGLTAVGKDVPPFAIAVGKDSVAAINVIGLRRRNYPALRGEVKRAFKTFLRERIEYQPGAGRIRAPFMVRGGWLILGFRFVFETRNVPDGTVDGRKTRSCERRSETRRPPWRGRLRRRS